MKYRSDFHERFIFAVRQRGIKQIELSSMTGISRPQISEYLKGKCKPKQDKLYAIAMALDVDPVWLMGYDVPMVSKSDSYDLMNNINTILGSLNKIQLEQVLQLLKIMFPKEAE